MERKALFHFSGLCVPKILPFTRRQNFTLSLEPFLRVVVPAPRRPPCDCLIPLVSGNFVKKTLSLEAVFNSSVVQFPSGGFSTGYRPPTRSNFGIRSPRFPLINRSPVPSSLSPSFFGDRKWLFEGCFFGDLPLFYIIHVLTMF